MLETVDADVETDGVGLGVVDGLGVGDGDGDGVGDADGVGDVDEDDD